MDQDNVNLLGAFTSFDGFEAIVPVLLNTNSTSTSLLALQGLFRIEEDVRSGQFQFSPFVSEKIRELLRKWRCESPLDGAYGGAYNRVVPFLRSLTIFKHLEVPLFIDDYGDKRLMSNYGENVEKILIDLDTPIVHVTHSKEKIKIVAEQQFTPSDNKNSIEGTWFSPKCQLGHPRYMQSMFGNWAFETTLRNLGVSGIRQGEIVSYKNEVNFILYASSDTIPQNPNLHKATDAALRRYNPDAYGHVSIFVPSRFLGQKDEQFKEVIQNIYKITHGPFCVKVKRNVIRACEDLQADN